MDISEADFEGAANELERWVLVAFQGRQYLATAKRDAGGEIVAVTISKLFSAAAPLELDPRRAHRKDRRRTRPL